MDKGLSAGLVALHRDLEHTTRLRLRLGGTLVMASAAMAVAGWQAVGLFGFPLAIIFGSLPTAALGTGMILHELGRARVERRRLERADREEESALRAAITDSKSRQNANLMPGGEP